MSFWGFRPYVLVAARRAQAAREIEKFRKKGRAVSPVVVEGRKIAKSFWGKAWCDNLERYSDYANRLPRGRTYVSNGLLIDLQIERGKVEALVSGSEIYNVKIDITATAPERWKSICADCAGSVGSLVELLQGKLSKNVMERVCHETDGLFPAPREITMSCSCPDWAGLCKHVAATLYGVGARLDHDPELLFMLRGVNRGDMVSVVDGDLPLTGAAVASERVLADDDVAALFDLDMSEPMAPSATKLDIAVAGATRVATRQEKSSAKVASSDDLARVKTKTKTEAKQKMRTTVPPSEHKTDRKPPPRAPFAPTSGARKAAKLRSVRDTAPVERSSAAKAKGNAVANAGEVQRPPKKRGPKVGPVGRTRAAKWIGARAPRNKKA
jgi:uncharacterized Zn finger protein